MTFEVTKGKTKVPAKILLYGPPGIGKTTFISQVDKVLIADSERGSHGIDCARVDIKTAQMAFDIIKWFKDQTDYETLVIDSFTKIQTYLTEDLLKEKDWKSLEEPGYGKGFNMLKQKISRFISACDWLSKNGKNVVVIGHTRVKAFYDPMTEAYDRYEPDILDKSMSEFIATFDAVLFYKKKLILKEMDKGDRVTARTTNDREMYATERASFMAKNRYGLPDMTTNPNPKEYFNGIL